MLSPDIFDRDRLLPGTKVFAFLTGDEGIMPGTAVVVQSTRCVVGTVACKYTVLTYSVWISYRQCSDVSKYR